MALKTNYQPGELGVSTAVNTTNSKVNQIDTLTSEGRLSETGLNAAIAEQIASDTGIPALVGAAVTAADIPGQVEAAATGLDILTVPTALDEYLRIESSAPGSRIPSGVALVTYGDAETTTPHWASLVASAHALTGWPGSANANKRGSTIANAPTFLRSILRATPYVPGEAGVVALRAPGIDVGVSGDDAARKVVYANAIRTALALIGAETRIEDTSPVFTYSSGFTTSTASAAWSEGTNHYGSGAGIWFEFNAPAERSHLLVGGHDSASNALLTMTDLDAAGSVVGTFNTSGTQLAGFTGPVAWEVPASARGHRVRVTRTSGTASLTLDALIQASDTPPATLVILNHKLSNYGSVSGATNGSDAAVDAFNTVISTVATEFPGVILVSPDAGWNASADSGSGLALTAAGMTKVAAAIEAAVLIPAVGTAGLTVDAADARYAPIGVSEGPLYWTDPRVGGLSPEASGTPTDQTDAWNRAMDLIRPNGGELHIPGLGGRIGLRSDCSPVYQGMVTGVGFDYSEVNIDKPSRGTVLWALTPGARLIQLGATGTGNSADPGKTGAAIRNLSVWGDDIVNEVVTTQARRNWIDSCQVGWGLDAAIGVRGQNTYIEGKGVAIQHDRGDCVAIRAYFDHKVFEWELREMGETGFGVGVYGTIGDVTISRIHAWAGANGVGKPAKGLVGLVNATGQRIGHVNIADCILEGLFGPELYLESGGTGSIQNVKLTGSNTFNNDADGTFPVVRVVGNAGGNISEVVIATSGFVGKQIGPGYFTALIEYLGAISSTEAWEVVGVVGRYVDKHVLGTPPQMPSFTGRIPILTAAGRKYANNRGQANLNGGSGVTSFTIPHGLSQAPRFWDVTPTSPAAAGFSYVTADATNLTVVYSVAPATGAANVNLQWSAGI